MPGKAISVSLLSKKPNPVIRAKVILGDNGVFIRKEIRDGYFSVDISITELGFTGVENTDWENIKQLK